ncbi:DUF3152 domain-containing protein [Streptomyces sp. NPDC002676]
MGRHSRRGPASKDDPAHIAAKRGGRAAGSGKPQDAPTALPPGLPGQRRAPVHGAPTLPDGTPAHGMPRFPDGTPAHGTPEVRGGHPEQHEPGGGWGEFAGRAGVGPGAGGPGVGLPRQRQEGGTGPGLGARPGPGRGPRRGAGPRQEYLDAFGEELDVFAPRAGEPSAETREPYATEAETETGTQADGGADAPPAGVPAQRGGGKGRAFTGIAAAAVTTALAIVVAGHVTARREDGALRSHSATDQARDTHDPASRGDDRTSPSASPVTATLTYEQKMDRTYPLSATLKGSGKFDTVPGFAKAPGTGRKYTYRVDVERGLGLDGVLFADAVQKTLNDERSWSHGGARTFERVSSGKPDFVITLASPGTTAKWCAKSGLDTTQDNVSCDSAATERVMINAYRWAQGSKTYGNKIHPYRQMLINHEVGHRLGHGHVSCQRDGELAPVMQQQTKFLDHDGIHCLPNPWPFPKG